MLLKVEFNNVCNELKPELTKLITACGAVLESESLKQFLRYVLHTGNYINSVSLLFIPVIHVRLLPFLGAVYSNWLRLLNFNY